MYVTRRELGDTVYLDLPDGRSIRLIVVDPPPGVAHTEGLHLKIDAPRDVKIRKVRPMDDFGKSSEKSSE